MKVVQIHYAILFKVILFLLILCLLSIVFISKPNPSPDQLLQLEKSFKLDKLDILNHRKDVDALDLHYKRQRVMHGILNEFGHRETITSGKSRESLPSYEEDVLRYEARLKGQG